MKHYYSLNDYHHDIYGKKVYKLSISSGCTCPNRDGTLDTRGCIFCSEGGSGEFSSPSNLSVTQQLEEAKKRVQKKTKSDTYIAYFQPFSNTYGDVEYLRRIYEEAIAPDDIVALSIATRPDCLQDEVLSLIEELSLKKPVSVELGLQTIHEGTARYIRRGYPLKVYEDAVRRLHKIGVHVVTHLILGLPGETKEMMLESVRFVGGLTDGVKLQLLHIIEGTDLCEEYRKGLVRALSLEEYTDILCDAIELLPERVVIHRITGDGAKRSLVSPLWSADKKQVLNYINREMDRRNISQGSRIK